MGADPRIIRMATLKLGELDIQSYTVLALRDLSLSDEVMDALPVVRGLVGSGRWVAVVGDKQCIARLISAAGLREHEAFTHETPFTAFLLMKKDDVARRALGEIAGVEIDDDAWASSQVAVLQNHRGDCRLIMLGPTDGNKAVLDNLSIWRQILDNYKTVGRDVGIDDVVKDVREKLLSGGWFMAFGEPVLLYALQFLTTKLCREPPTTYVFENKHSLPVYEVSLVRKCGEFLNEYNTHGLGRELTEGEFKQLRAMIFINDDVRVVLGGEHDKYVVENLTTAVKAVYTQSRESSIILDWPEHLLN
jgi:hypothetical protein